MRRALLLALGAIALAAAGILTAFAPDGSAQEPPPPTTATTSTTTTATTATATGTTATATTAVTTSMPTTTAATATVAPKPKPRPKPKPKPKPVRLPARVTIGGIHVGGLSPAAAYQVVRAAFYSPLVLRVGAHPVKVSPSRLGAVAYARSAVGRARRANPGSEIRLGVSIRGGRVHSLVDRLAKRYDRDPVDSKLLLRHLKPFITRGALGKKLARKEAFVEIVRAIRENRRTGVVLPYENVAQDVSRESFGPVIVIRRSSNRLYLYEGMKPRREFSVATGQSVYPTPLGRFDIVVKWKDPWWYPPSSPWAKGAKPIPPGPGNPLGTRWMGLSAPGVGIHGTPDPASIGYSVSHGCIRMYIPQAEWLFDHVEVGTQVFIVPA